MISMYSIGLILFPHDTKPNTISFRRKFLFTVTILFSFLLINWYILRQNLCRWKYFLESPQAWLKSYLPPPKSSSNWIEDLDLAYVKAQESNKPIFLDFTGYTCTNCRWMEINIFEQDDVIKLFQEFILVKLYTDGREEKHKRYRDLEINRFKTAALPYYVVLNKDDEVISTFPGYNTDVNIFIEFLEKTIKKHNEK